MSKIKDIPFNQRSKNPIEEYAEVKESSIHGWGLFAKQDIPEATVWWHARPSDVQIFTKDQFETLINSQHNKRIALYIETLLTYSYYAAEFNVVVFCLDNMRYMNHGEKENSGAYEKCPDFCSITLRDIKKGEEITEDYRKYVKCDWIESEKSKLNLTCF